MFPRWRRIRRLGAVFGVLIAGCEGGVLRVDASNAGVYLAANSDGAITQAACVDVGDPSQPAPANTATPDDESMDDTGDTDSNETDDEVEENTLAAGCHLTSASDTVIGTVTLADTAEPSFDDISVVVKINDEITEPVIRVDVTVKRYNDEDKLKATSRPYAMSPDPAVDGTWSTSMTLDTSEENWDKNGTTFVLHPRVYIDDPADDEDASE